MDEARILVVDDDPIVRRIVVTSLQAVGYVTTEAADGEAALAALDDADLVVLDVVLPDADGLDVLARIRTSRPVPVVMLSGRSGTDDRVLGLELGADDYLCKPFTPRELVARVRSVLRRSSEEPPPRLVFDGITIDTGAREVRVGGTVVDLTTKEFDVLAHLAGRPRRVQSREQLLEAVWESKPEWQDLDTVTEHVRRLRRKIEADPAEPRWVRTVRGSGYLFAG